MVVLSAHGHSMGGAKKPQVQKPQMVPPVLVWNATGLRWEHGLLCFLALGPSPVRCAAAPPCVHPPYSMGAATGVDDFYHILM